MAAGLAFSQAVQQGASPTSMPGQVSVSTAYLYLNKMHYAGTWSASATYNAQDLVLYDGVSYISLQVTNSGNTPSVSPTWWVALSASGEGLASGTYCIVVSSGAIAGLAPCSGTGEASLSWAALTNTQWNTMTNTQWSQMTN
jgi:hypothetical protein